MMPCKQLFAATATCVVVSVIPSNLDAQQTTPDGVRLENAVNRGVDSGKLEKRKSRILF